MSAEGAFLDAAQLANRWRPLSPAELADASDLLAAAGQRIREKYREVKGVEIADNHPGAIAVSVSVVKTAITTGAYRGHASYSRTEGPRAKAGTFTNPAGSLVFDDWHWQQLGLPTRPQPKANFPRCDY